MEIALLGGGPEIVWDGPTDRSMHLALRDTRIERGILVAMAIAGIGAAVGAILTGALPLIPDVAIPIFATILVFGVLIVLSVLTTSERILDAYPLIRSDALILPPRSWFHHPLAIVLPWDQIDDLQIEHPKRETGAKWEAGGPDLRITVTTTRGRVVKAEYDGAQDIPWLIHDPLVDALKKAWSRRG